MTADKDSKDCISAPTKDVRRFGKFICAFIKNVSVTEQICLDQLTMSKLKISFVSESLGNGDNVFIYIFFISFNKCGNGAQMSCITNIGDFALGTFAGIFYCGFLW